MAAERFEFKLLGPLEVSSGGYVVPVRAAKQRVTRRCGHTARTT
jgi:3,4-dihydroxy-2-butanone 4-phosphate synthase